VLVISWKQSEDEIGVRVEDTGVGLDPENAEKIFDPFFTTKPHGIGMGLSISRTIVESHEGKLWATPRPAGGTIFQFTIPVHAPKLG
jgi:signal transduction histidine kinase